MSLPTLQNCKKGFTLIEVLISIAILSGVMLLLWQITNQTIRAKTAAEKREALYHTARVSMNKMMLDFSQSFLLDGKGQWGLKQGAEAVKTEFRGSDAAVHFASLSHQRLFQGAYESESAEIGYRLESDPDAPDLYRLLRRESKIVDDRPDDSGVWIPLAEGVKRCSFQYYDGEKFDWLSTWNSEGSEKGRLPRAVKIDLILEDPKNSEEDFPFETIVFVEMYANKIDF